jgi:alkanesulfonate monooxygenase SsuD/methylene tetrahydromethanopterin reductase-like flavin-dependent oxidoreductase (luciferase family)
LVQIALSFAEDCAMVPVQVDPRRYADPAKVHRLDRVGRYFRSRGPFSVARSPQGHPVLIQAGQSGRGQAFAGVLKSRNIRQIWSWARATYE